VWFSLAQHWSPIRALMADRSPLRDRYLERLQRGELVGAVAVAHLRRPGPANPLATRVPGGWRIDGTLDWVTSWDIADVWLLWAADDEGNVVAGLLPAGHSDVSTPGLSVGEPLRLLAMSGTHTRPLVLEGVVLRDEDILLVQPLNEWMAADDQRTPDAQPAAFGLIRGAVAELASMANERADDVLAAATERLGEQCREIRAAAYGLGVGDSVDERLRWRAAALDLAMRATSSVVTARAGSGMATPRSAERRVREAMFLAVQAQTRASRDALLAALTCGP
jgi:alkylation response protein AidB-like acyl-CoA dehydrogenase